MNKMQKSTILVLMVVVAAFQSIQCYAARVRGYYRKNGTYVASYERADSSSKSRTASSGNSYSSYSRKSAGSSYYVAPKSYTVYQQRQQQGPRVFPKV